MLREHRLYAKLSKCEFWMKQVAFLGHVISKRGISVDPSKVQDVLSWNAPTRFKMYELDIIEGLSKDSQR
jgi:hypothetical protein